MGHSLYYRRGGGISVIELIYFEFLFLCRNVLKILNEFKGLVKKTLFIYFKKMFIFLNELKLFSLEQL